MFIRDKVYTCISIPASFGELHLAYPRGGRQEAAAPSPNPAPKHRKNLYDHVKMYILTWFKSVISTYHTSERALPGAHLIVGPPLFMRHEYGQNKFTLPPTPNNKLFTQ